MELELLDKLQQLGVKLDVSTQGDLKIKAPKGIMNEGLLNEIKIHKDKFINFIVEQQQQAIPIAEIRDKYPLTSSQKRLWFLNQFDGGSLAYNIPIALNVNGNLEIEKLRRAFDIILQKHEILRTVFDKDNSGEVYQKIIPQSDFKFSIDEKDGSNAEQVFIEELIKEQFLKTFDLSKGPLFNVALIKCKQYKYVLCINMNHILCDGVSLNILIREIFEIYGTLIKGEEHVETELNIQYKDYVLWLLEDQQQAKLIKEEKYWLEKLSGELPVLELPSDNSRPALKTYNGKTIYHRFSNAFKEELLSFASSNESTLFMVLTAGLNTLFARYTNNNDIILGTSVSGREHRDIHNQIGLFLNTIVIRTHLDMDKGFSNLLLHQKKELLDCYSHQNYPFDELVDKLNINRDTSRSPLFDVLVELHDRKEGDIQLPNHDSHLEVAVNNDIDRPVSQFDMTFSFLDNKDDLLLSLEFNTDIYNDSTIYRLIEHFQNFVLEAVKQPEKSISEINYLSPLETSTLLKEFNETAVSFDQTQTIIDVFESQVNANPDKIAVKSGDIVLTYKEIDDRANQLANHLIDLYSIKEDDLILLLMDRSELFVISILGVWKAGGAYIPVEPEFPDHRIKDILESSKPKLVISEEASMRSSIKDSAQEQEIPLLLNHQVYQDQSKNSCNKKLAPSSLSYVIFTSGSTGKPKGAMIEHIGMLNHLYAKINTLQMNQNSVVAQNASQCFDISVWQLFTGLMVGGQTIIYDKDDVLEPAKFIDKVKQDNVTVLEVVPSYLSVLMDYENANDIPSDAYQNIQQFLVTGEALIPSVANRWITLHPDVALTNAYGPTEASDDITQYVIDKKHDSVIPIGNVLQNLNIYVLDDYHNHCGIGVKGELCVSGIGVGRGYLYDSEKTASVFVEDPFKPGVRMYKTGDIARFREDGIIEFFGRKDFQVKIRGYRIELGEIENVLLEQKDLIKKAVTTVQEIHNEKYIIAYIVPNQELDTAAIKRAIQEKLPNYMIPGYFVEIDDIPLSRNGKVNRKALPKISNQEITTVNYTPARDETEEALVAIWKEVLGDKKIGVTDNFFELGGHSLKAIQLINRIKVVMGFELHIKDVFLNPTIEKLKQYCVKDQYMAIPFAQSQESYPLSSQQNRLWILSQFDGGNVAYNIPIAFWLNGDWNLEHLEKSFQELIKREENLRTIFKEDENDEIRQFILPPEQIDFRLEHQQLEIVNFQDDDIYNSIQQLLQEEISLQNAPLFRVKVLKIEKQKQVLVFNIHHIIADGWSIELLFREVTTIYKRISKGEDIQSNRIAPQYKDYVVWSQSDSIEAKVAQQESFWLDKFSESAPILELPSFKSRPLIKTFNGDTFSYKFTKEVSVGLRKLSDKNQATLFMTLMACVKGLFYKYTNVSDIVLGVPVAGRNHPDLENQIGLFLNTLAIRSIIKGAYTFEEWLQIEKQELLDAYSNQDYPFDVLVDKLRLKRDTSRSALFDVMVELHNYQNLLTKKETFIDDLSISEVENTNRGVSQFDMTLSFVEKESNLELFLEYNKDIYDVKVIETIVTHLEIFMTSITHNPQQMIDEIDYVSQFEKDVIFHEFKGDVVELPQNQTVVDIIESKVQENPNKVAITYGDRSLTYQEFNAKANQIADCLNIEYDINQDDLVCVLMDRSEWFMIAILAIWKSAGAYIPIDPDYPKDRIKNILHSSKTKLVICADSVGEDLLEYFKENQIEVLNPHQDFSLCSSRNLEKEISANNLSYVIYTSGSTGTPKGAMVEHLGMLNHLYAKIDTLKLDKDSIVAQNASQCFDISVWQFFSAILVGGQTVIYSKQEVLDPPIFINKVYQDSVTILEVVPSYLSVLMDYEEENEIKNDAYIHLKYLMVTGETLIPAVANRWIKHHQNIPLVNAYGPTEASDDITQYEFNNVHSSSIPIGTTLQNLNIYILDDEHKLCGIGVKGELCVSGVGVGRGYLHNPEKTAPVFIEDPFRSGERMYKTGDIARYRYDGVIEFFGRRDFQVKIRGHRIELGEIENTLLKQSTFVKNAVVEVKEIQKEKAIVAYIVPTDTFKKSKIKKVLENVLPYYMIPAHFVPIKEVPLTRNGKVDRKSLPEITSITSEEKEIVTPINDTEQALLDIWKTILKIDSISTTDNFFELGGNSLSVGILMTKIRNTFKINISFSKFFLTPTIKETASIIAIQEDNAFSDLLVKLKDGNENTPLFIIHPIGGNISSYESLVENLPLPNAIYGIQSQGLFTDQKPLDSVIKMASLYIEAIKQIQKEGPYSILGWSFGGMVAFEMSFQLFRKGDRVENLFLIDSYIPHASSASRNYSPTKDIDIVSALLLEQGANPVEIEQEISGLLEEEHFDFLWAKVLKIKGELTDDEREVIKRFIQVFRANEKAFYGYEPASLELSKLYFYHATQAIDNTILKGDVISQWSNLISGEILEIKIEGNHYSILDKQRSKTIGKSIQQVITKI